MADFIERMCSINVKAMSPDESVRAQMDAEHDLRFVIADDAAVRHDVRSLAAQIEAAAKGALRGFNQALDTLRSERRGPRPDLHGTPQGERKEKYAAAVAEIKVSETSPEGRVKVGISGDGGFRVALHPRSLNDIQIPELTTTVNTTVAATRKKYSREIASLRKKFYRT